METVAMTCREYSQIARTVFQYTWTGPAIDDERKVLNPKHVKVGNLTYEMILDILLGKGIIYETGVRKYAYAGAPE